jgi:hypothetical protein
MTKAFELRTPHGEIVVEVERVDCTPTMEPDPAWRFTDKAGHAHRWTDEEHLTFEVRYGEPYIDADGEEYSESWWACKQCGEVIRPGFRVPRTKQWAEVGRNWRGWFVSEDIGDCGAAVPMPPVFPGCSGQVILTRKDTQSGNQQVRYEFIGQGELIQEDTL